MHGHRAVATVLALTLGLLGAALPLGTAGLVVLGLLGALVLAYAVAGELAHRRVGPSIGTGARALPSLRGADAGAQRAAVAGLEEDLREAMPWLQRAAAAEGHEARPWVLLLGGPQSGKSSLLGSSGQSFEFATAAGPERGPRGCRWWVTPEAVWIDTSGALVVDAAGTAAWVALLRYLGSIRPTKAIDVVVVTVAAETLAGASSEEVERLGVQLRARVDEALGYLGLDVPVHLMVTRADSLPGFHEFFADLREGERAQVWGHSWAMDVGGAVVERAAQAFDALQQVLAQRSVRRTTPRESLPARMTMQQFPQWFAGLRPNLMRLVAALFDGRSGDAAKLRGLYFSSAAPSYAGRGDALATTGGRGPFLRDWIRTLVLPDRDLGGVHPAARRRRLARRNTGAALLFAIAVLVALLPLWSWREDSTLLDDLDSALLETQRARVPRSAAAFERLRAPLATVRAWTGEDAPWWTRYGIAIPAQVSVDAGRLYARWMRADVIDPAAARLRTDLAAFVARSAPTAAPQRARVAEELHAYELLTSPRGASEPSASAAEQARWLVPQLGALWSDRIPGASAAEIALRTRQLELFVELLGADGTLAGTRDGALDASVRAALGR